VPPARGRGGFTFGYDVRMTLIRQEPQPCSTVDSSAISSSSLAWAAIEKVP
jgi:hypothetical protein